MRRSDVLLNQRGMTLIEVMVVVFIIGLSAGIVVLTLPERPSQTSQAVTEFAHSVEQAQHRAMLMGTPVGLQLTEQGYRLLRWQNQTWQPERARQWPTQALDVRLLSDGYEDTETARPSLWPDLIFDPTGVNSPAEVQLVGRGERFAVTVRETGEVDIAAR